MISALFQQSNGHDMNGHVNGDVIDEEEPKGGLEVLNDVITSLASQNYANFNSSKSKWGNPVVPYRESVSKCLTLNQLINSIKTNFFLCSMATA